MNLTKFFENIITSLKEEDDLVEISAHNEDGDELSTRFYGTRKQLEELLSLTIPTMTQIYDDLDTMDEEHDCSYTCRVQGGDIKTDGISVYACEACKSIKRDLIKRVYSDVAVHALGK